MKWTLKETPFPPLDDDSGNVHPEKMTSLPAPPSLLCYCHGWITPAPQSDIRIPVLALHRPLPGCFFFFFSFDDWLILLFLSVPEARVCLLLVSAVSSTRLSSWNSRPVRTQGLPLPGHFPQKTSVSLPLLLPPDGPRRLNCSRRLLYLQVFDSRVYIPCIISSFHIPAKYPFFRCVFWLHFRLSKPFSMHESHPRAPGMVHPLVSRFQKSRITVMTHHLSHCQEEQLSSKGKRLEFQNSSDISTDAFLMFFLTDWCPAGVVHLDVLLCDQCHHLYLCMRTLCWHWLAGFCLPK